MFGFGGQGKSACIRVEVGWIGPCRPISASRIFMYRSRRPAKPSATGKSIMGRRPPLQHPSGLLRILLRLPILLYRLRLGWLFGNRFLLYNPHRPHQRAAALQRDRGGAPRLRAGPVLCGFRLGRNGGLVPQYPQAAARHAPGRGARIPRPRGIRPGGASDWNPNRIRPPAPTRFPRTDRFVSGQADATERGKRPIARGENAHGSFPSARNAGRRTDLNQITAHKKGEIRFESIDWRG
jgi:hypothetical protein